MYNRTIRKQRHKTAKVKYMGAFCVTMNEFKEKVWIECVITLSVELKGSVLVE